MKNHIDLENKYETIFNKLYPQKRFYGVRLSTEDFKVSYVIYSEQDKDSLYYLTIEDLTQEIRNQKLTQLGI